MYSVPLPHRSRAVSGSDEYRPERVRSDTPLYALTAVWYGPNGMLPPARYTAWTFGIVVTLLTLTAALLVLPLDFLPRALFGVLAAPAVGLGLTKRVFQHIDYYLPVRGVWQIVKAELTTPRPPRRVKSTTYTSRPHLIKRV